MDFSLGDDSRNPVKLPCAETASFPSLDHRHSPDLGQAGPPTPTDILAISRSIFARNPPWYPSVDYRDSPDLGHLGGVPREQKMLKGHLPRVMYHVYEDWLPECSRSWPFRTTNRLRGSPRPPRSTPPKSAGVGSGLHFRMRVYLVIHDSG